MIRKRWTTPHSRYGEGRPKISCPSDDERETLERRARRSQRAPAIGAAVPHIVLECAKGQTNTMVAARLHLSRATVGKWRQRFVEQADTRRSSRRAPTRGAAFGAR